jgi:predicted phage-related endonuclease
VTEHDRSKFLGGSDAAAVMGLSPWATPVELWRLKTGRDTPEPPDPVRLKMLERGKRLEPFIRDMVIDKLRSMGLTVELIDSNARYNDLEHQFLSCEIDFELQLTGTVIIGEREVTFDGEVVNADAKSVTGFARKKWGEVDTEDVPIEYAAQFMHGLMVTGRRCCLVAALRSFDDVDIFWTVRDDETIAAMRPKLVSFWLDHVQADVPPDPITFSDIKLLFPLDNGEATAATEDIAKDVAELREVKKKIKDLEDREKVLTFDIGEFISPNARLTYGGKDIATWKAQRQTRLDQGRVERALIYRHVKDELGERFERIEDPVAEFSSTKTIRVLLLKAPSKNIPAPTP